MPFPVSVLAFALALSVPLASQEVGGGESTVSVEKTLRGAPGLRSAAGLDDPVRAAKLRLEEVAEARANAHLLDRTSMRMHLSTILSSEPRRLSPGAAGDVHLVLSLRRDAVVQPGQHFALQYDVEQSGLQLGDWVLEPPRGVSTLAPAFEGQLVYDNTIDVRVPVRVASGVDHGQVQLQFTLECDVYDGRTGNALGRCAMPVRGNVTIGPPLPQPRLRPAEVRIDSGTIPADAVENRDGARDDGFDEAGSPAESSALAGRVRTPGGGGADVLSEDGALPGIPEAPADSIGLTWILGAAGVVVLLVLVLAMRGRS